MTQREQSYPHAVGEADEEGGPVAEDLPRPGPELRPLNGRGGGGRQRRLGGEVEAEEEEERHGDRRADQHVVVHIALDVRTVRAVRGCRGRDVTVLRKVHKSWTWETHHVEYVHMS